MTQSWLLTDIQRLGDWNYALLALLVIVEGPVATLAGAAVAATGALRPGLVFITAATSNLFADSLWYLVGYMGGTRWPSHIARRLGIRRSYVTRFEREMKARGPKILFTAKLTLSFSIPALIAAGIAHVSWRRAMSVLLPAEALWTGSLVLAGYWLGESVARLERGVQVIAIAGGVLFIMWLTRYLKKSCRPEGSSSGSGE